MLITILAILCQSFLINIGEIAYSQIFVFHLVTLSLGLNQKVFVGRPQGKIEELLDFFKDSLYPDIIYKTGLGMIL